ncbi:MAG: DUF5777 family beta-barrel protein [Bacteroidota bacterium]|nr:DUF5777 family beta-barrel protein [Bacteroidota bacterium]
MKNTLTKATLTLVALLCGQNMMSQSPENLLNSLDSITPPETAYTYATFKSTRVINGHSIERMKEGQLDFRVSHRFGLINQGAYELFGLDQGTTCINLEYGIKDWVMVGISRASVEKTFSGLTKFSLLRQSSGVRNMPVSVSYLFETSVISVKWSNPDRNNLFSSRFSYLHQLLIARKWNERFSLQISPTLLHRNLVATEANHNDVWALGLAGRYKITRRTALNAEYYPRLNPESNTTNCLSIGFDVETGGHVFQLLVSNSTGMIEKTFIGETTGKWSKGDLHLGFNISRVFALKGKKNQK